VARGGARPGAGRPRKAARNQSKIKPTVLQRSDIVAASEELVWRGLEGPVWQGRSGGGLCYGYDVARETDAGGAPVHGGRTINEAEAEIVRRILAEFADGRSPRRIAHAPNREHQPGPRGGEWDASTINGNAARGTGILNKELYIGKGTSE
jgi:hypothetical protein